MARAARRCRSASTSSPTGACSSCRAREGLLLRHEPDGSLVTHADLTAPRARRRGTTSSWTARGNAYVGCTGFDFPGGEFAPGLLALRDARRRGARGGRRRRVPQRRRGHAGRRDARARRVLRQLPHGLGHRSPTAGSPAAACGRTSATACPTASAATPRARSGTPTSRTGAASAWREGGEVLATVDVDRGCFACMLGGADGRTLYIVASEWRGPTQVAATAGTGQVLTLRAPAAHAGRP